MALEPYAAWNQAFLIIIISITALTTAFAKTSRYVQCKGMNYVLVEVNHSDFTLKAEEPDGGIVHIFKPEDCNLNVVQYSSATASRE
jgi:hypothetical protein